MSETRRPRTPRPEERAGCPADLPRVVPGGRRAEGSWQRWAVGVDLPLAMGRRDTIRGLPRKETYICKAIKRD